MVGWAGPCSGHPRTSVTPACDAAAVGWTDVIDAASELMPRRWKRKLGSVLVVAFLLFPTQARDVMLWYGRERATQLMEVLTSTMTVKAPEPSSPAPNS